MSLARQLGLIIVLVFAVVFAGTLYITVSNNRAYLAARMTVHAQDTATSLGLALGAPLSRGEMAVAQGMVQAVADRGYYSSVKVQTFDNKILAEHSISTDTGGVPAWFVATFPVEAPVQEALVMSGWRQLARVFVAANPGRAYAELWEASGRTLMWFSATLMLALVAVLSVLKLALKPLAAVEGQALAIGEGEFPVLEHLPRTRELRSVVAAMNKMSRKVERMLLDKVALIEQIEEQANRDSVTGLFNRVHFESRLAFLLGNRDEFPGGALLLVRLAGLASYNDRQGHAAGDALLKDAAEALKAVVGQGEGTMVARFSGAEFVVLKAGANGAEAQTLAAALIQALSDLYARRVVESPEVGHLGIALVDAQDASQLFAEADMALRAAAEHGGWYLYGENVLTGHQRLGAGEWRQLLEGAIAARSVSLATQPVLRLGDGGASHQEVLARLTVEGEPVTAAVFMPQAERHGLAWEVDRLVLEQVLARLAAGGLGGGDVAVNISASSLRTPEFAAWLGGALGAAPDRARRLILEVPEYAYASRPELLREFIDGLKASGCRFGIDRFGVSPGPLGYLRGVRLAHIKVDGSYAARVTGSAEQRFYLEVLADIAHGLDIAIGATAVESAAQAEAFKALGFDAVQGHHTGRPEALAA